MHILQAERDALLKPLNAVTGIVERRHTLPILANVLIEKRGNALSFLATDLEIQITTASQGEVAGEDFRLTTSAKKLQDLLSGPIPCGVWNFPAGNRPCAAWWFSIASAT